MTDPKHDRATYNLREAFIAFLLRQLGEAYIWGANGGTAQDCSGLVTEAMRTFRALTEDGYKDKNAHGWMHYFLTRKDCCVVDHPYRGCLIGWDVPHAGHIAVCLDDRYCIEASGGSWTDYKHRGKLSKEDWRRKCVEEGAQVCVRTIARDRTVHACVDPFLWLRL